MKKIPIGINDFKTLIENNYYYIDKTKHIEDILMMVQKLFYSLAQEDLEKH